MNILPFQNGSGWLLDSLLSMRMKTAKYNPIGGSSYIPTPEWIRNRNATVNIQNTDDRCFLYAYIAHYHPVSDHPERVSSYQQFEGELNMTGVEYPVNIAGDLDKIEAQVYIFTSCVTYSIS